MMKVLAQRFRNVLLIGVLAALFAACPDTTDPPIATDTDATGDAPVEDTANANRSYYRIVITEQDSPAPITVERDITDKLTNFAFGSTHIAPAVSLAVSEDLAYPAVMNITFNFGIVLGSQAYPIQCDQAGEYAFGGQPPEIDITKGIRYISSVPGSTGAITITSWTRTEGEVFAGTFQGRIRQQTDNVEKRYADIEGEFHFILPAPAAGQPN